MVVLSLTRGSGSLQGRNPHPAATRSRSGPAACLSCWLHTWKASHTYASPIYTYSTLVLVPLVPMP
eukprot:COSAG01_NODE_8188_length_2885_cov_14.256281_2_plen_66_part_00